MNYPAPYRSHSHRPQGTSTRSRSRKPSNFVLLLLALFGLSVVILSPLVVTFGTYAYYQFFGLIYPRVRVGQVDLAGMTAEEAAIELHTKVNLEGKIQLSDGIHNWSVRPEELGLNLDPWATAQEAIDIGHGQSMFSEMAQMIYGLLNGWDIQPVVTYDSAIARSKLEAWNMLAMKPAQNASLIFDGSNFSALPAELGYEFNIEEVMKTLDANPAVVLQSGVLGILLKPIPPQITDVSGTIAEAQRKLDTPIVIQAYDPISDEHFNWTVPREVVGGWLTVAAGEQVPVLSFDETKVADYLNNLDDSLNPDRYLNAEDGGKKLAQAIQDGAPVVLTVRHNPTTYVVNPGDTLLKIGWRLGIPFWMILNANPGLDPDNLVAGQTLTIPSKDDLLPLSVVPNKRIVISISKQRLWVYQDGELIHKHVISTGVDRSPTQPGIFQVQTHEKKAYASIWDLTMPNFLGIYEAWPGFMNGIHGLPTLSSGRRLWANILGKPASYGCIILDLEAAENLYNWAEEGVVVEIQP